MKASHFLIGGAAVLSLSTAAFAEPSSQSADTVRQVQLQLNAVGYDVGIADGIMGPRTAHGLRMYQQVHGMAATGQIDGRTMAELGLSTSGNPSASSAVGRSSSPSGSAFGAGGSRYIITVPKALPPDSGAGTATSPDSSAPDGIAPNSSAPNGSPPNSSAPNGSPPDSSAPNSTGPGSR